MPFITFTSLQAARWVHAFLSSNPKVSPVREITSPEGFVDKNALPRKLLSSLIYDMAKQYAVSNIRNNVSRKEVFDAFWGFFFNLHAFEKHSCSFKEKPLSLKMMCNHMFSTAVSYSLNRMTKSSSRSSN